MSSKRLDSSVRKEAFTLIELLVVIAIIALLLSIIVPSLNMAKRKAAGAVCMSNEKQLSLAWTLFAADHDEEIVDGQPDVDGDGFTDYPGYGRHANFVSNPITPPGGGNRLSLEGRILGLTKGGLWPYLGDYKVWHCPGDKRTTKDELRYGYRTYSIGAVYSRIAAYITSTGEQDVFVTKTSQIKNPGSKFVFLEEMDVQQEYNDNTWNIFLQRSAPTWFDPVAVWHGDSSTFGYADGHAERHKWVGSLVKERAEFDSAVLLLDQGKTQKIAPVPKDNENDLEDWNWIIRHYESRPYNNR